MKSESLEAEDCVETDKPVWPSRWRTCAQAPAFWGLRCNKLQQYPLLGTEYDRAGGIGRSPHVRYGHMTYTLLRSAGVLRSSQTSAPVASYPTQPSMLTTTSTGVPRL